MMVCRKYSSSFILAVFITAQLGEPIHYLWINHSNLKPSIQENTFKSQVVNHTCSHFHYEKNRNFLPATTLETSSAQIWECELALTFFYENHFVEQVITNHSVRGPPTVV